MPVEIRHMRGDQYTVNGLTAYKLGTTQSTTFQTFEIPTASGITCYAGIRVWKRTSGGVETELTAGTPVAQVSRTTSGTGFQSNTWDCPQTALQTTDAIVVRVYLKSGTGAWELAATFITEQLGALSLDAATWTVYYYTDKYIDESGLWFWAFDWGDLYYDSRIENFTWTPSVPVVVRRIIGDGLTCCMLLGLAPAPPPPPWEGWMDELF